MSSSSVKDSVAASGRTVRRPVLSLKSTLIERRQNMTTNLGSCIHPRQTADGIDELVRLGVRRSCDMDFEERRVEFPDRTVQEFRQRPGFPLFKEGREGFRHLWVVFDAVHDVFEVVIQVGRFELALSLEKGVRNGGPQLWLVLRIVDRTSQPGFDLCGRDRWART